MGVNEREWRKYVATNRETVFGSKTVFLIVFGISGYIYIFFSTMMHVNQGTRLFGERRNSNRRKIGESILFFGEEWPFYMKEFRSTAI